VISEKKAKAQYFRMEIRKFPSSIWFSQQYILKTFGTSSKVRKRLSLQLL